MEKTGESYTAARAALLAAEEPKATEGAGARGVGRGDPAQDRAGMEKWFDLLDEWGAAERSQREAARPVAEEHRIEGGARRR